MKNKQKYYFYDSLLSIYQFKKYPFLKKCIFFYSISILYFGKKEVCVRGFFERPMLPKGKNKINK